MADFSDYLLLGAALWAGVLLAVGMSVLVWDELAAWSISHGVVYGIGGHLLLAGSRMSLRGLRDLACLAERRRAAVHGDARKIILCGAGPLSAAFLQTQSTSLRQTRRVIAGLVDDDPNLRLRLVCGHPVLGNTRELSGLIRKHAIDQVVITSHLSVEAADRARAAAAENRIAIVEWQCAERGRVS